MQQPGSKYFSRKYTHAPRVKRSNMFYSDIWHVAYQNKGNGAKTKIYANIISLHIPSTHGVGQRVKYIFISESGYVAYQIKDKEM